MIILTANDMTAADHQAVQSGATIARLMENAGAAVALFCRRHFAGDGLIVVLCGKGNNGGDGNVAARRLAECGRAVRVALLCAADELTGDAAQALKAASSLRGVEICEIANEEQLREALKGATLFLDAVVGTGFKPPLRGLAAIARDLLNSARVPVVSIDLPTGWDADCTLENPADEIPFRSDAVVTFVAPKLAHVYGHLTAGKTFGPVVVAQIWAADTALTSTTGMHWAGTAKALAEVPRAVHSNKGTYGHVLLIGGAYGKAGAPSMASLAAMRSGAGLVTGAIPRDILSIVAAVAPELMLTPLATDSSGGLAIEGADEAALQTLTKGISLVAIGPGLGQEGSTPEWVRTFIQRITLPMVIDADALNALAGCASLLGDAVKTSVVAGKPRTIVLTPHPGEMARLVGMTVKQVEADREGLAQRFATEHGVTVVLKGWRTLIAHPDGRIAINTTGNPSMAKGGSGDILTGIVAAMLAQYPHDVSGAVEAAVFLHGLAGDFAALAQDEHTVLATETVNHLWHAFRSRVTDLDGFTWISGTAANNTCAVL